MGLQFRRGIDSDRTGITPSAGEPLFTTDTKKLYIGDGSTAGGILVTSDAGTDSATVTSLITSTVDSAYIQARQADIFRDSAFVTDIVDAAYIQARDRIRDSNFVQDIVDSAYVNARVDANLDSTATINLIDSAYVQARQDFAYSSLTGAPTNVSSFTNDEGFLDSTTVTGVINASYIQSNQITYSTADFTDSAYVAAQIDALIDGAPGTLNTLNEIAAALNDDDSAYATLVGLINDQLDSAEVTALINSAYVQARQITYNTSDFTDSTFVTGLSVSTFTNDANYLDSTTVTGVIDASYIQSNQTTYNTSDFTDSAYVTGLPVSTFTNDANYLDSTTVTGVISASYIQSNQTTYDFLDSAETIALIDSAYVQARETAQDFAYSSLTGAPTNVSSFTNDEGFLDSTTVTGVISASYIQSNQTTYSTADFPDSAFVTGLPVSTFTNDASYSTFDSTNASGMLSSYAPLASPALTGTPTAPTASSATNSTQIATTAFVTTAIDNLIDGAPGTLNTLNEIAAALNDDDSAYATLVTLIGQRLDSAAATGIIDSAYVQLRQDYAYSSLTGAPTNVSSFTNDANYLDSTTVTGVINASYIQSNQTTYSTADFTDSAFVTGLPVSTFTNDANYLDSTTVTGVIDATYIQANQTTYDFLDSAETNALIDARVTNTFLRGLIDDSSLIVDGNGSSAGVTIEDGAITIRTGTGNVAYVDLYCEVSNAHRTRLKSAAHSAYSGNVDVTLPTSTGTLALTSDDITGNAATATALATARTIDVTGVTATGQSFDGSGDISIEVTAVPASLLTGTIDSARLPTGTFGGSSGSGGTDSATVITLITSTVDSAYVALREANAGVSGGGLDSALTISLIDSAYVQARQSSVGSGGLDSAAVIALVGGANSRGLTTFEFIVDSGATSVSGVDHYGQTLSYNEENVIVYVNGIVLRDSDYTATNGTSITFTDTLALNDEVTVHNIGALGIDSAQVLALIPDGTKRGLRTFEFTADSGDDSVSGIDIYGQTLSYRSSSVIVYLNGVLLRDSDYGSTNGTSISFTSPLALDDEVTVHNFVSDGLDSAEILALIPDGTNNGLKSFTYTADSGATAFSGADNKGNTLTYLPGSVAVFLNGILLVDSVDYTATSGSGITLTTGADSADTVVIHNISADITAITVQDEGTSLTGGVSTFNFVGDGVVASGSGSTKTITIAGGGIDSAAVTNLVDSAYVQARQVDVFRDSAFVTGLIDSAYVQARENNSGGGGGGASTGVAIAMAIVFG